MRVDWHPRWLFAPGVRTRDYSDFETKDGAPSTSAGEKTPGTVSVYAEYYAKGSNLDKTVGRNSATVGWICIARCTTVYGAFAYMTSSKT